MKISEAFEGENSSLRKAYDEAVAPQTNMENKELTEDLASMEHARWSRWQKYLHSKCTKNPDGSLTIPSELVIHWERQISTPYSQLSEKEKESDRKEVRPYIELASLADKQGYLRAEEEIKKRVGLLRQWLNEDRITDTGRMVDNWQIERFLFPQAHDAISKLKEV